MLETEIKRKLKYDSESGKLHWKTLPGLNRYEKWFNTKYSEKEAGSESGNGYLRVKVAGTLLMYHRVCWFLYYGNWPKGSVDHINRCRFDNRICNLRDVTHLENNKNKSKGKNNTSQYTGVSFHRNHGKWYASIKVKGKSIHLGSFDSKELAYRARLDAEIKYGFHETHGKDL